MKSTKVRRCMNVTGFFFFFNFGDINGFWQGDFLKMMNVRHFLWTQIHPSSISFYFKLLLTQGIAEYATPLSFFPLFFISDKQDNQTHHFFSVDLSEFSLRCFVLTSIIIISALDAGTVCISISFLLLSPRKQHTHLKHLFMQKRQTAQFPLGIWMIRALLFSQKDFPAFVNLYFVLPRSLLSGQSIIQLFFVQPNVFESTLCNQRPTEQSKKSPCG